MATNTYRNVAKNLREAPILIHMGTSTCYRIETGSVLILLTGCDKSKTTNSLILVKIVAELERTKKSKAQQIKSNTEFT